MASLCSEGKRFNELKRDLGLISPRILTKELKYLEMRKRISREADESGGVSLVYYLAEHGKSLDPLIEAIVAWGQKHREAVLNGF